MSIVRNFLGSGMIAATLMAPTIGLSEVKLEVASTFPKGLVFLGESADVLAERLGRMSGGDVTMEIYGAGDLVPAFEVFNAVSTGAVPAGWDWIGYWAGTVPVTGLAAAMPFGPDPAVFMAWMKDGGGEQIVQRAYDKFNVKFIPCHVTAPEPGGWFNKEINSVEDFQGLKMRISGLGGKVLNKLGASTQVIPGGEIYVALERGRIEATEFSLPIIDKALGFNKIAKYYYYPGWHQPASWNSLIINMDVWKGMTDTQRTYVEEACNAQIQWSMAVAMRPQGDQIAEFEARGTEVRRFPAPVLAELEKYSAEVLNEEAAKDPLFKEALDSIKAFMAKANRWQSLQELPRTMN